jgi:hypothetical protein
MELQKGSKLPRRWIVAMWFALFFNCIFYKHVRPGILNSLLTIKNRYFEPCLDYLSKL